MTDAVHNSPERILVTGAAGFIGARVCELLLAERVSVVGVDNLNASYDPRLKEWRLNRLLGQPGFSFHKLDITDREPLSALFPVDAVIHLAARAGVRPSIENPWLYFETNVTGTLNLLELSHQHGVPKFVFSSSSSVYGNASIHPVREDTATDTPLSPYAASKKSAEVLCYSYHHLYGLDVTILRNFTVYGPAGRPDMSLFRFVQRISEEQPITLYGDGHQSRDFTYIDDVARGTVAALLPLGFAILNLGSNQPLVLLEAIHLIEQLTNKCARIERRPAHAADVMASWADNRQAQLLLDWSPGVSYREGLARLVNWYRDNRSWAKDVITA
jgi:UDP-glucuronate 4-epimerase